MALKPSVRRLIWVRSGGLCAFSDCRAELAEDSGDRLLGEIAHIVGQGSDGPRAGKAVPGRDINGPENLLLLCPTHHTMVDAEPATYTVERLTAMKDTHEQWVRDRLGYRSIVREVPTTKELVHSTLLPVERMPTHVFVGPCHVSEPEVGGKLLPPTDSAIMLPYIVREKKLFSFFPLTSATSPFAEVVSPHEAEPIPSADFWSNDDLARWYVTLLNRSLNKLTGRRKLNLDKEHQRYYFEPITTRKDDQHNPVARDITYRALNQASTRHVVWQPKRRKTGEKKQYWIHLAVGLRFHRVTKTRWVLSVRPERRFTVDGFKSLVSKATGRRSTSQKSHMYNHALLKELQFWKEYLSDGTPRIIFDYGGQSLIVNARLVATEVTWPGVPGDVKPFTNVLAEDDLFTSASYVRARQAVELDSWEVDDLGDLVDSVEESEDYR